MFQLLESALASVADNATLAHMFEKIKDDLEQFIPAAVKFIDIGPHKNIGDAVAWLAREEATLAAA